MTNEEREERAERAESIRAQARELFAIADQIDGGAHHARPPAPVALQIDHAAGAPPSRILIPLKVAAGRWRRSDRNMRKIAADHGALFKIGGRNMVDESRLRAAIFGRTTPIDPNYA